MLPNWSLKTWKKKKRSPPKSLKKEKALDLSHIKKFNMHKCLHILKILGEFTLWRKKLLAIYILDVKEIYWWCISNQHVNISFEES